MMVEVQLLDIMLKRKKRIQFFGRRKLKNRLQTQLTHVKVKDLKNSFPSNFVVSMIT